MLWEVLLLLSRDGVANLLLPDVFPAVDLLISCQIIFCTVPTRDAVTFKLPIPLTFHRRLRLISSNLQYSGNTMHHMIVRMAYVLETRCRNHQAKMPVTAGKIKAIMYVCKKQK